MNTLYYVLQCSCIELCRKITIGTQSSVLPLPMAFCSTPFWAQQNVVEHLQLQKGEARILTHFLAVYFQRRGEFFLPNGRATRAFWCDVYVVSFKPQQPYYCMHTNINHPLVGCSGSKRLFLTNIDKLFTPELSTIPTLWENKTWWFCRHKLWLAFSQGGSDLSEKVNISWHAF